ncbi:MAG: hypothetical protein WAT19_12170 [Ferruginibacter sp.]
MPTSASISQEMLRYFMQLNDAEKKSVLLMLKTFLGSRETAVTPQSLDQYNKELDEAMERIDKGHFTGIDELEKEMESW